MNFRIPLQSLWVYVFVLTFFCSLSLHSSAQDSSRLRISLVTCAPGNELYSIFGHSAMRITDSNSVTDLVFNYGTFNFDEEDFYIKFMRGKLLYYLSVSRFDDFKEAYEQEGRSIREQVLDLSAAEKIFLQHALMDNLREDKKYYLYDFFLDNCTTRLRDLIEKCKSPQPLLPAVMPQTTTFRQAIHQYLQKGNKEWSQLGIDILLGARTDAVMTTAQQQFLPDNLMTALDSCGNTNLVAYDQVYPATDIPDDSTWLNPMYFSSGLLLILLLLSKSENPRMQNMLTGLSNFILFMTGMLGILLLLMWVYTDHKMTKENFNLLWTWPLNAMMVFINRQLKWVKFYFLLHIIFLLLTLAAWFFLPQRMNSALIPWVVSLILISFQRIIKRNG